MPGKLYAVVDTNIFHECLTLDQPDFPWRDIGAFDEIELIVTSPVQQELDRHKKDTRPRIKRRAVQAVAWFRQMLTETDNTKVLRASDPRVTIRLDAAAPSHTFPEVLDYSIPDDRIVGVAVALAARLPEADFTFLTHDTGPAMKAKAIGLPFTFFPVSWHRPEEEDEQQKEIRDLRSQINTLKHASPILRIAAQDQIDRYRLTLTRRAFAVLTTAQLTELQARLLARLPLEELTATVRRQDQPGYGFGDLARWDLEYVEPTASAAKRFASVIYPEWVAACMTRLKTLAHDLNLQIPSSILTVNLFNEGSRPAEQLRITFTARGSLRIAPPPHEGNRMEPGVASLPEPPSAPAGYWKQKGTAIATTSAICPNALFPRFPGMHQNNPPPREDHNFYYEPSRPETPVSEFRLNCRSFRHGLEAEKFEIEVYPGIDGPLMTGAIAVQVYASNVSPVLEETIPIEVTTDEEDVMQRAFLLISAVRVPSE